MEQKNRKPFLEQNYCWFSCSRAVGIVQQKGQFVPIYGVKCPYPLLRKFLISNKTGNYVTPSKYLTTKVKSITWVHYRKESKSIVGGQALARVTGSSSYTCNVLRDNRLRNFPRYTDQSHHRLKCPFLLSFHQRKIRAWMLCPKIRPILASYKSQYEQRRVYFLQIIYGSVT